MVELLAPLSLLPLPLEAPCLALQLVLLPCPKLPSPKVAFSPPQVTPVALLSELLLSFPKVTFSRPQLFGSLLYQVQR